MKKLLKAVIVASILLGGTSVAQAAKPVAVTQSFTPQVTATVTDVGTDHVTFEVKSTTPVKEYKVYRDGVYIGSLYSSDGSTYTDSTVTSGTTYNYKVTGYDDFGTLLGTFFTATTK